MGNFEEKRGRPAEHPVARLSRRVWAINLRAAVAEIDRCGGKRPARSWAALEHRLVGQMFGKPLPSQPDVKGLHGVAGYGNDPRRLEWRVDADVDLGAEIEMLPTATRTVPGPRQSRSKQQVRAYRRIQFDAVVLGEQLAPGSSRWLYEPLWWLVAEQSPRVDQVRQCVASSLRSLGIVRPTLAERRRIFGEEAYQATLAASRAEILSVYRSALEGISAEVTPELLTLLIGLVKESDLTGEYDLYEVHHALLCDVFKRWSNTAALGRIWPSLFEYVVFPFTVVRPVHELLPTDPLNVPMTMIDWSSMNRTLYGDGADTIELPSLGDVDGWPL